MVHVKNRKHFCGLRLTIAVPDPLCMTILQFIGQYDPVCKSGRMAGKGINA